MSKRRDVAQVVDPLPVTEGAGVRLRRSIAGGRIDYLDPFLLFDHFGSEDPRDYLAGFPLHPHRGIETVTYMLDGEVAHKDSLGNAGTIGAGDVQWMTAGSGILHEEMPKAGPRRLDGFQVWVNLPAKLKMTRPRYQDVASTRIPGVERADGVQVRVIAGEVEGVKGAVKEIYAEPEYLDVSMPPGRTFEQPVPRGHTAFAYLFQGEAVMGADEGAAPLRATRLVVFGDGDQVSVRTLASPARFLLLSGRPLGEPVARYGPFVMNTEAEIRETLRELRAGTFIRK
ncbi:MAG TPA: pirin family protein [Anaeromyxobacteraceae bacterium]|nr:pirin family protein [Anaeromyxobacteraceae bacterium]